jgi:hypothetical protein
VTSKITFQNLDVGVEKAKDSSKWGFIGSQVVYGSLVLKRSRKNLIDSSVDIIK